MKSSYIALVILGAPALMFGMSGVRAYQLAKEGEVPEPFRDLNCDGKITYAEWLRGGIDFRVRPSTLVPGCQEIYMVKTPDKAFVVRCEAEPKCRLAADLKR